MSWIILQVFRRFHFTVWLFVLIDSCNYVSDGFTYVIISTTTNLVVNSTTKMFNVVFSFKKWLNFPRRPNDVKFYFAICIELWRLGKIFWKMYIFIWERQVNRNCFSFIKKPSCYHKFLVNIIEIIDSALNDLMRKTSIFKNRLFTWNYW